MRNKTRARHNLKTKRLAQWIAGTLAVGMALAPFCSVCCWISFHSAMSNAATEEVSCHQGKSNSGSPAWNHFESMQHCASADAAVEPPPSQNSFSLSHLPLLTYSTISGALIIPPLNIEKHLPAPIDLSPQTERDSVLLTRLRV
jgi:hypothetical protein